MAYVQTVGADALEHEPPSKLKANPMIQVSDLEKAFQKFFDDGDCRSLDWVFAAIKTGMVGWKTAPKVSVALLFVVSCSGGFELRFVWSVHDVRYRFVFYIC